MIRFEGRPTPEDDVTNTTGNTQSSPEAKKPPITTKELGRRVAEIYTREQILERMRRIDAELARRKGETAPEAPETPETPKTPETPEAPATPRPETPAPEAPAAPESSPAPSAPEATPPTPERPTPEQIARTKSLLRRHPKIATAITGLVSIGLLTFGAFIFGRNTTQATVPPADTDGASVSQTYSAPETTETTDTGEEEAQYDFIGNAILDGNLTLEYNQYGDVGFPFGPEQYQYDRTRFMDIKSVLEYAKAENLTPDEQAELGLKNAVYKTDYTAAVLYKTLSSEYQNDKDVNATMKRIQELPSDVKKRRFYRKTCHTIQSV